MKKKSVLIALVLAVALIGCGKQHPKHIVILPDVSGSIDRQALEQAFNVIDELASHLQRGDELTIIPILSDAEAEVSGRILRFKVPANRQAYDTDLRDSRTKLRSSLKEMQANAISHRGSKTDILGSVELAEQEFKAASESKRILIILSDFIEEDQEFDFRTDHRLKDTTSAQKFATQQAMREHIRLDHIEVYLGLLKSPEFTSLEKPRREALKDFWIQYFDSTGAGPGFFTDGPGLLKSHLSLRER